ncbi:MAG: bifunctional nuclease family protein [Planctomycetes bacterium]|nr:bifunctional nuclease family protein [Planctomycetota bacterium]
MIPMELSKIVINETSDEQIVILKETNGARSFPIVIGIYEAAAIDRKVKNVKTARPLTHDLILNIIKGLGANLLKVVVNDLKKNTFYANLVVGIDGKEVAIDSRPSDAIVLAIQTNTPIFVEDKVLNEVINNSFGDVV